MRVVGFIVASLTLVGCTATLEASTTEGTEGDAGDETMLIAPDAPTSFDAGLDAFDAKPPSFDSTMVDADAGSFDTKIPDGYCPTDEAARPNEGLNEEAGSPGCPKGMVAVAGTTMCIDRYEASLVIVGAGGSETSWSPYYPPPSTGTYRAVSLKGAVPQGYISGVQAQKACAASKKRLCTDQEWVRACRGTMGNVYPYGNVRKPGVCNDARTPHPAASCFGTTASWIYSELDWPGINQQPNTIEKTGENPGCVSADGAFDMMGNLHEWVYDDPSAYSDPLKAIDFRGGFYADTKVNGEGCLYRTSAHGMTHWDYSTGFRCCADKS